MLDPIREGFPNAVHHRDGRLETQVVRDLHDLEPAIGSCFLARDLIADALYQDLATAAGDRVESRCHQRPDDFLDRHAEPAREEIDFRWREAVDVNRVVPLDVPEQIEIPLERDVGVVTALHQNLHAADRFQLVDLAADFFVRQQVALGMFGPAIERAEFAVRDADVGVVDVSIDDVRHDAFRMQLPARVVSQAAELVQRRLLVQLEVGSKLGRRAVDHHATCMN